MPGTVPYGTPWPRPLPDRPAPGDDERETEDQPPPDD